MNALYNIIKKKSKSKNEKAFLILFYMGVFGVCLSMASYMFLVDKYVFSLSFIQIIKLVILPYVSSFSMLIIASIAMTYIEYIKTKMEYRG